MVCKALAMDMNIFHANKALLNVNIGTEHGGGEGFYLPCLVMTISVPEEWKAFQRSEFTRLSLMLPCFWAPASEGDMGLPVVWLW